jgi:lactoylglutathione lyase
VTGPAGEKWEVYTVLADSDTFGASPQHPDADADSARVCCGGQAAQQTAGAPQAATSCC